MAKLLASRGYELVLCARREDRLSELAAELPTVCRVIAADVSDEEECRLLYRAVRGDDLEIVINNAGFGLFGEFLETDLDEELRMIDTNIRAVHILTKLAVQDFEKARPRLYPQCRVLSRLSARAAHGDLLRNKELCAPSDAGTPRGAAPSRQPRPRVCALSRAGRYRVQPVAGVKFSLNGLDAKRVAREAIDGLFAGRAVIVPGVTMKARTVARHFAPDSLLARITYHFQHKKGAK